MFVFVCKQIITPEFQAWEAFSPLMPLFLPRESIVNQRITDSGTGSNYGPLTELLLEWETEAMEAFANRLPPELADES